MSAKRIALDTKILFYAVDRDAGIRHRRAITIVARAAKLDCVLPLQVLCEFFAAVTRKRRLSAADATEQIEDWKILFPVVCASPRSLTRAMHAVSQHQLAFWDAMIWAVAREANVTLLLSEDFGHEEVLDGVCFRNPFRVADPFA
ncbi:MAG TPA: PIN domain-containing protein [Candidatus Kryptonia bacterium]|nr:PIN domain-containing protein [Candidatus Kryptonia bacterium]